MAPQTGQIVMLRSLASASLSVVDAFTHIKGYMERKSDQIMLNPIVTFKGEKVMAMDRLSNHSTNETFLIFDGVAPQVSFVQEINHIGKS